MMRSSIADCSARDVAQEVSGDLLFLESLMAEANRIVMGLNAVQCQMAVVGWNDEPVMQVVGQDRHTMYGQISGERLEELARRVRAIQGLLHGGT
ncbi:MAG: hypothetical protein G8237_04670 [Magnetococcales bacterium]|nr:hypothetical protein [Magnetococcales bacterium]